ncbi:Uncharacterized protein TCM_041839 [Theobroma cacao]|uniref:Uncharacterized protein n=1 Tax=Theobroma cacao TaxID=3641 RepID=A0A061GXV8_THECC|nr:Uncharacterized protein TCM_041839 [Theobroma cacao]
MSWTTAWEWILQGFAFVRAAVLFTVWLYYELERRERHRLDRKERELEGCNQTTKQASTSSNLGWYHRCLRESRN